MEEENNPIKNVGENNEVNQNEQTKNEEKVYQAEVINQNVNTRKYSKKRLIHMHWQVLYVQWLG